MGGGEGKEEEIDAKGGGRFGGVRDTLGLEKWENGFWRFTNLGVGGERVWGPTGLGGGGGGGGEDILASNPGGGGGGLSVFWMGGCSVGKRRRPVVEGGREGEGEDEGAVKAGWKEGGGAEDWAGGSGGRIRRLFLLLLVVGREEALDGLGLPTALAKPDVMVCKGVGDRTTGRYNVSLGRSGLEWQCSLKW